MWQKKAHNKTIKLIEDDKKFPGGRRLRKKLESYVQRKVRLDERRRQYHAYADVMRSQPFPWWLDCKYIPAGEHKKLGRT